jgi:selenocysteine lyase/cysteine desulfurase
MQRFKVPATVRASFAVYNSEDDIAKLVAGVEMALGMLR